jgi:hypothetical protein
MVRGIAVMGCAALLLAAYAGAATKPALRLVSRSPVVVSGTGFKAHEHVAVAVSVHGQAARTARVVAAPTGSFKTTFRGLTAPRCSAVVVIATRASGAKVRLVLAAPGCVSAGE